VSPVKQQLLTLPEHLSSPPVFSGVCVAWSLVFCVVFCRSLFVLFLLAILLSVLVFTDSHYPLGIFKLFFWLCYSNTVTPLSDLSIFFLAFRLIDFDFWCFNATFSNISTISWRTVLVVEEAGVPGENHRPWTSNW
jgi:hypothetical protein